MSECHDRAARLNGADANAKSPDQLIGDILGVSGLACQLADMYTQLRGTGQCAIVINRWVRLTGQVDPSEMPFGYCFESNGVLWFHHELITMRLRAYSGTCPEFWILLAIDVSLCSSIRPYHTILMRQSREALLEKLPPDASAGALSDVLGCNTFLSWYTDA